MQEKKKNFLEKIVKRNYNNELEKLLEEKQFEENAKSTLLNILYKIETGYKDIETVKKDGHFYLIVSAEEHYKESDFLTELRKGEDLKDTVSSLTLYMFTNDGRYYCMPQRYLIDSQGRVCGDLGSSMQLQMIDDEIIFKIYTNALKTLEDKNRFRKMMEK